MPRLSAELTPPQVLIQPFDTENTLARPSRGITFAEVRSLRKDPTIRLARMLAIAPPIITPWSLERTRRAPADAEDLLRTHLFPHKEHLLRHSLLGSMDFGYQPFEKVFETTEEGFQVVSKFKPLLQDFTEILVRKGTGRFAGLSQEPSGTLARSTELSVAKSLVVYTEVEGTDWYGLSISEAVKETLDFWTNVQKSADRYDKKAAGSHWVVHYPEGTSLVDGNEKDNADIAEDILANLKASGGVAVPNQVEGWVNELNKDAPRAWRIELLSPSSNIQLQFIDRLKYLDALKVRAYGFPERSILEGTFGTKAEAGEHADIAMMTIDVRHRAVLRCINQWVVNQLLELNFGPSAKDTIFIVPSPIVDTRLALLKEIYDRILQHPDAALRELERIDARALKDDLGLPLLPEGEVDEVTTEESSEDDSTVVPSDDNTAEEGA